MAHSERQGFALRRFSGVGIGTILTTSAYFVAFMTVQHPQAATHDYAAWAAIAVLALLVAWCQWITFVPADPASATTLIVACGSLGLASWFYRTIRLRENFAVMCIALAQVLLFSAVGVVLSYLLARNGGPLWDERLMAWDQAIGFEWRAYVDFVDRSALLSTISFLAYGSLIPQIVALVLVLGFANRLAELRTVMLGAIVCGGITILVSALFPAVSYPAHLGLTAADFEHVNPWAGNVHMADLNALRDGTFAELKFTKMQGIITFPSYHAGLSAVTLWGFWASRISWIKWPGMTLAALTIAATPVNGGHYLVDVIAGVAIAIFALAFSKRAIYWAPAPASLTALPFRRSREASVP